MQFSERWLRSLVDPPLDSAQLGHVLTMAGLELESSDPVAPPLDGVVVAEILSAERHPDADRLQLCRVRVGEDEPLQIVCGAPNARAGLRTACARIGTTLPGLEIRQAKVRGVDSFGMLCSAGELGLPDALDGIMELPEDAPVGTALRDYLHLDDRVFTLKLTPNRGDCLSVLGVAREVSAISGVPIQAVDCSPVPATFDDAFPVEIDAEEACPSYCGRLIRGIDPAARTPAWMVERLERSGLRAIHPVVDVTNYVLLELGEPMHAFDLAKLRDGIHVRWGRPGEKLELLNEQAIELSADALVIADDDGALALAGIMGGAVSAVSDTTHDIFLEAAHFRPESISGRARRYALATDSSHRFERGVDPVLPRLAMERATRLILDICGGSAGQLVEAGPGAPAPAPIAYRPERARRLLGLDISDAEMHGIFGRLGLKVEAEAGNWRVTPPSYRFDLGLEVDLVEEVARVAGYDRIPSAAPRAIALMHRQAEERRSRDEIKNSLVSIGYNEIITYSFISNYQYIDFKVEVREIPLLNPIAQQMGVMRGSLLPGLVQALRHNLNHGQERLRLFELGRCFDGMGETEQPLRLGGLAYGAVRPEQWGEMARPVDFFDVKGELEALFGSDSPEFRRQSHPALHPGRCAAILAGGEHVGWVGALHPRLMQKYGFQRAPVLFELDWAALESRRLPSYRNVSRFPAVRRDIAVVVDADLSLGEITAAVRGFLPETVTEFTLFDLYQGDGVESGKKSLAFRMLLQHTEKTLTDTEIEQLVSRVIAFLSQQFNAVLRG